MLWAQNIFLENRNSRKAVSIEALRKTNQHPMVLLAVARLFAVEKKELKARQWFERAVVKDPDNGDAWAHWYRFELKHNNSVFVCY